MKSKILLFATLLSITFFIGCNNESVNVAATSNTITADETVVNAEIDATVDDLSIIAEDQFDMQKKFGSQDQRWNEKHASSLRNCHCSFDK